MDLLLRSVLPLSVNLNRYATKVATHIQNLRNGEEESKSHRTPLYTTSQKNYASPLHFCSHKVEHQRVYMCLYMYAVYVCVMMSWASLCEFSYVCACVCACVCVCVCACACTTACLGLPQHPQSLLWVWTFVSLLFHWLMLLVLLRKKRFSSVAGSSIYYKQHKQHMYTIYSMLHIAHVNTHTHTHTLLSLLHLD